MKNIDEDFMIVVLNTRIQSVIMVEQCLRDMEKTLDALKLDVSSIVGRLDEAKSAQLENMMSSKEIRDHKEHLKTFLRKFKDE